MGGCRPEGYITDSRNKGLEETGKGREEWRRLLRDVRTEKGL
jgi:Mn-dependent DtxR family transcriptional regulator